MVGALIISKVDDNTVHIRQVAVDQSVRGKNIGKKIMCFAEEVIETMGCEGIVLNARKNVKSFYEKLGYTSVGEEFMEPKMTVGMIYIKMVKSLK